MNFIKSVLGYFLAGFIINMLWSKFTNNFGISGGWIAALVLVGPTWYINHHRNFVSNRKNAVFIDMGLAVAIANVTLGLIAKNKFGLINSIEKSIPTLISLTLGAIFGVVLAIIFENKVMYKPMKKEKNNG